MKALLFALCGATVANGLADSLPAKLEWKASAPLVSARDADGIKALSMKDPSVVFHEGRWHLFCTMRGQPRTHTIVYCSFSDWAKADEAKRMVLPIHDGFFCAPQVFHFTPHKKWYLICQASDKAWSPEYQPAFATTDDLADTSKWTKLQPMFGRQPAGIKAWLDFWVIADEAKAHMFFTSLDGKMWRSETKLADFPKGWSDPVTTLTGDVFEASHTYRLKGRDQYLTLIEAQNGHGWRYYKAYTAERLDGSWKEWAAGKDDAFACQKNVAQEPRWTDSISHGELLRLGVDERLEVDPARLRFLFQGVADKDREGKGYGEIPWCLGLLEPLALK